ncbi:hypothetical protein [uncultured Amphritea sp.]|uniref:hypothetical protein n=1 Tax=uncultured Amphritea sp. TaxID=981605 RepID=UPI002619CD45|nr:hypothetical protein [uncultured Amphritea sp.]
MAHFETLTDFIRQTEAQSGTPPTSYKIFGHWHGTEIGQLLARCATVYIEPDNLSIAQQQLEDALSNLEKRQQNKPLQSFIENLTSKSSPTKLSEQEKAMLRNIGRDEQKH